MARFEAYGHTATGPVREHNEDHLLLDRYVKNRGRMTLWLDADDEALQSVGVLLAVADGIGGASAGEVASQLALRTLERHFHGVTKAAPEAFVETLRDAIQRANDTVLQAAASRPEWARMGCTLSGACLTPHGYWVFNAGDSRVYRLRNGLLRLLTLDDSATRMAMDAGQLSQDQAEQSGQRHVLTNHVGLASFQCRIEPGPELRGGDVLLVCSDGVHDLLGESRMEALCAADDAPLERMGQALLDAATAAGGHDNQSVILLRLHEDSAG
ncbi:PP2C family protein-serine/threonine phosphatase [Magnetofaba australis]|uniref:PPM-type phosphatase domain-containing protein n=1 Tax=Magnetofaba australis IT-1 TaxID=1434232 RepID=A0A1Y2JZK2_9PROT|nr:PP2C family serine/threonine-protein phosphatase [Magnetofaba australis]OSM00337.1 putative protein serine/threonine phosphatase [Magnetofaba australis IT-1]